MNSTETDGNDTQGTRKTPTLWAIGGGKGGVGKTLVTSSLAIAFARRGHRCAVIDLDLGAANVHTLLGVNSPVFTLSDFLSKKMTNLGDVFCATPYPNLQLLSGTRASLGMANPKHCQKEKLLRHIRGLDFDHVFLDLSAGSAFNALDFFLAADHGVAVVVPERTSIENTQNFLKTAFFRSLRKVAQEEPMCGLIKQVLGEKRIQSARDLIRGVADLDPSMGRLLASRAAQFTPRIVVNQLDSSAQSSECAKIARACRNYLTAGVRECGSLPRDRHVRTALREQEHVLTLFPDSPFSLALNSLTEDLVAGAPLTPRAPMAIPENDDSHLVEHIPARPAASDSASRKLVPLSPPALGKAQGSAASPASTASTKAVAGTFGGQATVGSMEHDDFLRCCREQHRTGLGGSSQRTQIHSLGELAAATGSMGGARAPISAALAGGAMSSPLLERTS
jgi:flagellar biosynthesis protein FlhG